MVNTLPRLLAYTTHGVAIPLHDTWYAPFFLTTNRLSLVWAAKLGVKTTSLSAATTATVSAAVSAAVSAPGPPHPRTTQPLRSECLPPRSCPISRRHEDAWPLLTQARRLDENWHVWAPCFKAALRLQSLLNYRLQGLRLPDWPGPRCCCACIMCCECIDSPPLCVRTPMSVLHHVDSTSVASTGNVESGGVLLCDSTSPLSAYTTTPLPPDLLLIISKFQLCLRTSSTKLPANLTTICHNLPPTTRA